MKKPVYLRLVHLVRGETYSSEEREELLESLECAPAVTAVQSIERHPRGGYAVQVEAAPEALEALLTHLRGRGYAAVF